IHGVVESLDHGPLPQGEGERIRAARAVELLAIVQRSVVVVSDVVSSLCARCLCSGESRAARMAPLPRGVCQLTEVGVAREFIGRRCPLFMTSARVVHPRGANPQILTRSTLTAPASLAAPKMHCRAGNARPRTFALLTSFSFRRQR